MDDNTIYEEIKFLGELQQKGKQTLLIGGLDYLIEWLIQGARKKGRVTIQLLEQYKQEAQ